MKISLAAALLSGPPLLILDESLNGLDPVANWRVRQILAELVRSGRHAVILSTHMVETVAAACTDVIFLEGGKITHRWGTEQLKIAQGKPGGFDGLVMRTLEAAGAAEKENDEPNAVLTKPTTSAHTISSAPSPG